jgi:hypothetical protein
MQIIHQQSPTAAALLLRREQLAAARNLLADGETNLAKIRAQLKAFEVRYMHQAGILYAELDELEARISEREVDLYDSQSARRRAREARERAQETHDAAFGLEREPEKFDPPPSLKSLFREVAKRIHPDCATDSAEQQHFTLLMVRANQAYSRGDTEALQRLLDDHREINASGAEEGDDHALLRLARQLQHAERDIAALAREQQQLLDSEIGQLYTDAEAAALEDRDLLAELAATLRQQVADAQYRFDFVDRQIKAHGK